MSPSIQLNPTDQRILEITKDLCQKLNISSIHPDWVSWYGYAPGGSLLTGRLMIVPLPFSKNLRLMADRETVMVTGTDQFLAALNKVGKLIPKLMVGKRPDSRYPFDRPGIKRRIEAIQSKSSQSN